MWSSISALGHSGTVMVLLQNQNDNILVFVFSKSSLKNKWEYKLEQAQWLASFCCEINSSLVMQFSATFDSGLWTAFEEKWHYCYIWWKASSNLELSPSILCLQGYMPFSCTASLFKQLINSTFATQIHKCSHNTEFHLNAEAKERCKNGHSVPSIWHKQWQYHKDKHVNV